jgi:hypothetical protein
MINHCVSKSLIDICFWVKFIKKQTLTIVDHLRAAAYLKVKFNKTRFLISFHFISFHWDVKFELTKWMKFVFSIVIVDPICKLYKNLLIIHTSKFSFEIYIYSPFSILCQSLIKISTRVIILSPFHHLKIVLDSLSVEFMIFITIIMNWWQV